MTDTLQSRFFKAPDGLNLHALVIGEGAAATPVVCLPGLTRPARDFAALAHFLHARKPRRVICLDYRGRGGSDWDRDPANYALPVEAADILAALEHLGVTQAHVVGLSRGGIHGMIFGATRPDLVRSLVLDDIGPEVDMRGLLEIKSYIGRLPLLRDLDEAAAHLKRALGAAFSALSDEDWRVFAGNTYVATPERVRQSYDPQVARTLDALDPEQPLPDMWAQFEAIAAPILALRGANSGLLSQATLEAMPARNPRCRIHVVPGQGHAPLLFDAETLKIVADFIEAAEG